MKHQKYFLRGMLLMIIELHIRYWYFSNADVYVTSVFHFNQTNDIKWVTFIYTKKGNSHLGFLLVV